MGGVLVHIDLDGDRLDRSSLGALAAGRAVASAWGAPLHAALIVHDSSSGDDVGSGSTANVPGIASYQTAIAQRGADKVVVVTTRAPLAPLWCSLGSAWSAALEHVHPRLVLFGADAPAACELAPRTAARLSARYLARARAIARDSSVELRDRDGASARDSDSGATVALIGGRHAPITASSDVDLVVLAADGGADPRIEVGEATPSSVEHAARTIIALDESASDDATLTPDVMRLATLFDAPIVRAGQLPRLAPLAPDLVIALGTPSLDVAGASSVVRIGAATMKNVDAALPAPLADNLNAVRMSLEDA